MLALVDFHCFSVTQSFPERLQFRPHISLIYHHMCLQKKNTYPQKKEIIFLLFKAIQIDFLLLAPMSRAKQWKNKSSINTLGNNFHCVKTIFFFLFHLAVDSQAVEIIGHHSEVLLQHQQHSQDQHTSGRPQKASSASEASMAIQWPYQQPPQPIGLPSGNTLYHNQLHHPG